MNTNYILRQLFFLCNQIAVIIYYFVMISLGHQVLIDNSLHIILISLLFFDAAYISYKNVQNNHILANFALLLLLAAWQFILSLFLDNNVSKAISVLLIPLTLFQTVNFLLSFLFQGSAYTHQKTILNIWRITSFITTISSLIEKRIFAFLFLAQSILALLVVGVVVIVHKERIKFIFFSQKKPLLLSVLFIIIPFLCYVAVFHNRSGYLENLGSYLIILCSMGSIHSILFWHRQEQVSFSALNRKKAIIFLFISICIFFAIIIFLKIPVFTAMILAHSISLVIQIYHFMLYNQFAELPPDYESRTDKQHFYAYSLVQIKREETLKKDFSNYLHDEILQDLLSIKNLMGKSERPQVRELIIETLEQLNYSIRSQMQVYHPILLKSLTLKENIQNLLNSITASFPLSDCKVHLDCDNNIFLVEPYNFILYRMIKELTTNAFKHSKASSIWVTLLQEKAKITLKVIDNGRGMEQAITGNPNHKGLTSIYEQVSLLDGKMKVESNSFDGTRITITMPMKGENSYESFIS